MDEVWHFNLKLWRPQSLNSLLPTEEEFLVYGISYKQASFVGISVESVIDHELKETNNAI
jgi:hypothetical protein